MDVPENIQKCVCFVGFCPSGEPKDSGDIEVCGTAFFVTKPSRCTAENYLYLVTARHILAGIADRNLYHMFLRVTSKNGVARWLGTKVADWTVHDDPHTDVAAITFGGDKFHNLDQKAFPLRNPATVALLENRGIGVGEELFFPGLFYKHQGRTKNVPIVRTGTIAAMPSERIATKRGDMDAYLIESRSIGGLSGSPVFLNLGGYRKDTLADSEYALLGLIHGHYDEELVADMTPEQRKNEIINMGISVVVPVEKILETLNHPDMLVHEEQQDALFAAKYGLAVNGQSAEAQYHISLRNQPLDDPQEP